MHTHNPISTTLALLFAMGISLNAQNCALTNLDSCINEAFRCNLGIKAQTLTVQKAKDMESTYIELAPTEISLSQDPTSGGGPENSISVSQSFDMPSVYKARKQQLKTETQVERQRLRVMGNDLALQVSIAYFSALKKRDLCNIIRTQDSIYSNCMRIAETKHRNGETGMLEKMNVEKTLKENALALMNAQKDYDQALASLQSLINTARSILPGENSLVTLDGGSTTTHFNPEATAADRLLAIETNACEKAVGYAKKGYLPSVSLAVKCQALIKGFNPYNVERSRFKDGNFMGFEVGVSVPLSFGSIRGKIKAAQRDAELSAVNRERQKAEMESAHRQLISDFAKAKQIVDYYKSSGMPQAREIERLSQVLYANGEIDYLELAQNLKASSDVKVDYLNAIEQYNQVVKKLNYLTEYNTKILK